MKTKQDFLNLFENPFCIVNKGEKVDIFTGSIKKFEKIADLPSIDKADENYISLLPYKQMSERGFEVIDGHEKILTLMIEGKVSITPKELCALIDEVQVNVDGGIFSNMNDDEFMEIVERVIEDEIKNGEGSNFLMSRKFFGKIKDFSPSHVLAIFKRLVENEIGSYWNFIFNSGKNIFVGASPERHLTIGNSKTYMNPICGTLPKKNDANFKKSLEAFIENPKEINELFQVVDEELKIICKLCPDEGKVIGPLLKEMATVIHTEYLLEGQGTKDIFASLRESLYAATMVGSPLENAARIITKYENSSRRYYSSVICMFGKDAKGEDFLDSAITIRTVEIEKNGRFSIQTGASIVRDSVPELECKEIQAKAQGLMNAIAGESKREVLLPKIVDDDILTKMQSRNKYLSKFWIRPSKKAESKIQDKEILLIDNEDDFIYMVRHILQSLGYRTSVVRYCDYVYDDKYALTVVGPGPGDPNNFNHDKMRILYSIVSDLLDNGQKILGICLGHQILSGALGFELTKSIIPFQGMQKEIDLFGEPNKVGFYNSYFAMDKGDVENVALSKSDDDKIYAIKGENFVSFQFHVESILTEHGEDIIKKTLDYLLP